MTRSFLDDAYGHGSGDAARDFYDDWAATYDDEIAQNGYATPRRCAAALADLSTDQTRPILDLGCGTGLSGVALSKAGFTSIDGWDPSPKMLKRAEALHVYRVLRQIEPEEPLTAPANAVATAVGRTVRSATGLGLPAFLSK